MNKLNFRNGSEKLALKQAVIDSWRGLVILHSIRKDQLTHCLLSALQALRPLVVLFLSSLVLSELSGERDLSRIVLYVCFAVGFAFFSSLAQNFLEYSWNKRGGGADFWERHQMMWEKHHAEMDFKFTEKAEVAALKADAYAKTHAGGLGLMRLGWTFSSLFGQFVGLVGAAIILAGMFFIPQGDTFLMSHAALILFIIASVAVSATINHALIRRQHRIAHTSFENLAKFNTLSAYYHHNYILTASGGLDVRIFNLSEPILAAVKKANTWFKGDWSKAECQTHGITEAVGAAIAAAAYLLIGLRALEGMYDIGEVTRFVGGVTAFYWAMSGLITQFSILRENAPYLGLPFDYMELPLQKEGGKLSPLCDKIEFKFENVSFKYPGTEKYVLKNINIAFRQGERLAVVGMNGSGKTTMIKLLCRLYEPTSGKITLNGKNIDTYKNYLSTFAVVLQGFCLMGLPLGQNVATKTHYDTAAVRDALEKTGFSERLAKLENGLETPLFKSFDKDGINISGGEQQKIVLARAIYKNAPFVIMDEPTAALDPIAEYEIYSKFNELLGDKTAIFISHRLSSCKFCHRIAVFHEGEIIQHGTHEDLLADTDGKYHEMWHAQAQYYDESTTG